MASAPNYQSQFKTTSRKKHAEAVQNRQAVWAALQRQNHAIAEAAADARKRAKPCAPKQRAQEEMQRSASLDNVASEAQRALFRARPARPQSAAGWNAGPGRSSNNAEATKRAHLAKLDENARRRVQHGKTRDELEASAWRESQIKQLHRASPNFTHHPETYGIPSRRPETAPPARPHTAQTAQSSVSGLQGASLQFQDSSWRRGRKLPW